MIYSWVRSMTSTPISSSKQEAKRPWCSGYGACNTWPWHVQGQKYWHECFKHPRGPNFHPFRTTMSRFWVTAQFLEKCTKWPQMTLTCSRSKIPTHMLHTPPMPKFSSVSLYDESFLSYGPSFGKVHWMTPNGLDLFKVKNTNMHIT